jgi:hypothetical protein
VISKKNAFQAYFTPKGAKNEINVFDYMTEKGNNIEKDEKLIEVVNKAGKVFFYPVSLCYQTDKLEYGIKIKAERDKYTKQKME